MYNAILQETSGLSSEVLQLLNIVCERSWCLRLTLMDRGEVYSYRAAGVGELFLFGDSKTFEPRPQKLLCASIDSQ